MRSLTPQAAALCAVLALFHGPAAAEKRRCVVAPLTALGIEEPDAQKVQRWVTAAMSGVPHHRWLVSRRIERILQQPRFRDCAEDPTCLGNAARQVGADFVVAGDVGSLSGAFMVYLRLVSRDGKLVRSANGVLDPSGGVRAAARALAYRLLDPSGYTGSIVVDVDVPNAWVYLDGRRAGRSPTARLEQVSVGTHALRVTHEAYRDFVRFVKVEFGQTLTEKVDLSAYPVAGGEMRLVDHTKPRPLTDSELPWYRRWWAVAGFGAVVLAATTTAVALLANRTISRDSEVVVGR